MDSDHFKKLNALRAQKAAGRKGKNKSIGVGLNKALAQSRKKGSESETEKPVTKAKVCNFLLKRESKCLPSQVPKADLPHSPLKLSRSTRNAVKCGYSSQSEAYVHWSDSYNPFDNYSIQNLGTVETFLNMLLSYTYIWV